jgi:hypothetical protein
MGAMQRYHPRPVTFLNGSRGAYYLSARPSACLLALLFVLALTPLWVPGEIRVHMLVRFTSKAFAFISEPLSFFIRQPLDLGCVYSHRNVLCS